MGEPTPDIADIAVDNQESESETVQSLSSKNLSDVPNGHIEDQSSEFQLKDSYEQNNDDNEYLDERCSRSPSPLSTSVDGGNCMSPSRRNDKSLVLERPRSCSPVAEISEDTSILLTSHSTSSKTEINASSDSRADTPNDVPELPKDEAMRSRSSSRSSVKSHQEQRSRSNSYLSPAPSRSISPSSRHSSPAKSRSRSRSLASRSPSPSPNRAASRNQSSSSSSSSSSSESESSSDDSRSSTPEIPKTPDLAPVQQLPIPKLRIKLTNLMAGPAVSAYKPVKVITSPYQPDFQPTVNGLANKLRSLNCKVNVPRLKFKVLDQDLDLQNGVKLHEKDIEELSDHKVTIFTKEKKLPEPDTSNKEMDRPPIAPIKIRLRTSSETVSNTGRSLSSILAEIVKEPCALAPNKIKDFSEFEIPHSEGLIEDGFLFSSSLTKSFSALAKFVETEICRDILNDVVIKVEESRKVSTDIIHEILDDIFFNEACCADILDNIVDTVVKNVETKREHFENERKADIMAQRKFMEQQKLKASTQESKTKNYEFQAVESVNMHRSRDNVKRINNVDNEKIVELPSEAQIIETCEQEADIEVLESTFDVYVSDDDSSIELSDSEFDLDGENPSIIEELKIDNPEEPAQSVISAVDDDTTPVRNDIESAIAESNNDEANMNFSQRVSSGDDQGEQIDTYTKELANEVIAEERKLQSSEKQDDQVKKTTMSQKANLSNKLKKKKIPKLLIKPIRKDG